MTEPPAGFEDAPPRRGAAFWAVLGVGLAVGLANVPKPVHIDDTLYLSIARRLVEHPLDPYGGTLNWQQFPQPTYNVSLSPPLLSYYFALPLAVAGENLLLLHDLMMPWVLLACWALYRLGERWADAGSPAPGCRERVGSQSRVHPQLRELSDRQFENQALAVN